MDNQLFYEAGLQFSCKRCSSCCRHEGGYVFLSENDLAPLAAKFEMSYADFITMWCRWVPYDGERARLSLREKSNLDCIFWGDNDTGGGCTVYNIRPLQCRSFPFWDSVMACRNSWEKTGRDCSGINSGKLYSKTEIENFLRQAEDEKIIERDEPYLGSV